MCGSGSRTLPPMKWAPLIALMAASLVGCPRPPDERTASACAEYASCGVCAAQPQCGWCMQGDEGVCIPNRGEGQPAEAPDSCGDGHHWHFLIADDPALPEDAPYCPREVAEDGS